MKKNFSALPALIILSWTTSSRELRDDKICKKVRNKKILQGKFSVCNEILYKKDFMSKS